jgi:hypothetical protein
MKNLDSQISFEFNDPDQEKTRIIEKHKLLQGAIDKMKYHSGHWWVGEERAEKYFDDIESVHDVKDSDDLYRNRSAA